MVAEMRALRPGKHVGTRELHHRLYMAFYSAVLHLSFMCKFLSIHLFPILCSKYFHIFFTTLL